jgi:hypothetical protein
MQKLVVVLGLTLVVLGVLIGVNMWLPPDPQLYRGENHFIGATAWAVNDFRPVYLTTQRRGSETYILAAYRHPGKLWPSVAQLFVGDSEGEKGVPYTPVAIEGQIELIEITESSEYGKYLTLGDKIQAPFLSSYEPLGSESNCMGIERICALHERFKSDGDTYLDAFNKKQVPNGVVLPVLHIQKLQ